MPKLKNLFYSLAASAALSLAGDGAAQTPPDTPAQGEGDAWHERPFGKPRIIESAQKGGYWERPEGAVPRYIVLHCTDTHSEQVALRTLTGKEVSAHYLVARDGRVLSLVPEDKAAWHAGGAARWEGGTENFNLRSIGIEIVNTATEPYAEEQLAAVRDLVHDIQVRHGIPPQNVVAHSDVSIMGRGDPGPMFPWEKMARGGIGLWPAGTDVRLKEDSAVYSFSSPQGKKIRQLLAGLGYDDRRNPYMVVGKFNLRYDPSAYGRGLATQPTGRVLRLAESLMQQKELVRIMEHAATHARGQSPSPGP